MLCVGGVCEVRVVGQEAGLDGGGGGLGEGGWGMQL